VELSAIVPVTKNFGFTVSGLVTRALNNGQGSLMTWAPTTNPAVYNLTAYRLQERPKITVRDSIGFTTDWRVTRSDVLSFGFQYAFFSAKFWVRQLNFATGTVASSGTDFTQGANGTGSAQIIYDAREKAGTTYVPTFRYRHNGPVWQWQVNGAFSNSTNYYRNLDKGYFNQNNAFLRNLTVRFEKMTFDHPEIVTVRNATNTAEVDPYKLANYKLESVSANRIDGYDIVRSVSAYLKRDFDLVVPVALKVGVDLKSAASRSAQSDIRCRLRRRRRHCAEPRRQRGPMVRSHLLDPQSPLRQPEDGVARPEQNRQHLRREAGLLQPDRGEPRYRLPQLCPQFQGDRRSRPRRPTSVSTPNFSKAASFSPEACATSAPPT